MNSFVGRFVKLFLIAAVPAVALFAVVVVLNSQSNDAETLDQQRAQRAAVAAALVHLQSIEHGTDVEGLAYRTDVASVVAGGDARELRLLAIRYRQEYGFDYLLVLDRNGKVGGRAHPELPGGDDPPPIAVVDGLRGVRTEGVHAHASGRLLSFGSAPILAAQPPFERVGVLVAGSWLDEDLDSISATIGAPLTIEGPGGLDPTDPRLGSLAAAGAPDYAIRVGDTADDPDTTPLALVMAALGLLSLAFGTALAWAFGRRMARPIESLTRSVTRFAAGGALTVDPDGSSDEVAELTESFAVMRDRIVERENDLILKNDELQSLLEARQRFVSSIAHELRTPLSTILGYTEILANEDSVSAAEAALWLDYLNHDAATLAFIVDDLLVMGKADIGGVSVTTETFDLSSVARDTQRITSLDLDPDRSVVVHDFTAPARADVHRTGQIIRNLVVNALRHGGPNVEIDGGHDDETAWIEVRDDGVGLQGIDADEMFAAFATTGRPGLTDQLGLGLFVSSELATRMGGSVSYRRDSGTTVFRLTLPSTEFTPPE